MWMDCILPVGTEPQVLRQVRGEGPLIGQPSAFSGIRIILSLFLQTRAAIYIVVSARILLQNARILNTSRATTIP